MEEKYILNCPNCGKVEGFFPESDDEPEELPDGEAVIEDDVVNTPAGPAVRVRCPRCGQWVKPDRARPA